MLGWMLNRGDNAPDVADAGGAHIPKLSRLENHVLTYFKPLDTTQVDMPDTPAPVFAARAFKSVLFGTPRNSRVSKTTAASSNNSSSQTPEPKPQGILLTPGTGAAKQKRVSFGRDVGRNANSSKESMSSKDDEPHKRTRLNRALEKAQQNKTAASRMTARSKRDASDDEWEEDDDDQDNDSGSHDMTLDLNEPHSESGRYWKQEYEKYHNDAKSELEKLLKYKQLAKSYAQQKDFEAIELAEKLKEEQQKVIKMEKKIAENASDILARHGSTSSEGAAESEIMTKLTKQTALAVQYRQRVEDLEDQLEAFLEDRHSTASDNRGSGGRRQVLSAASPRTQKTLQDVQRELRKARSQVKEVNSLRDQVANLKQQLRAAEKRAAKAEVGAKSEVIETDRSRDLRAQLREAREQSRKKDEEMQALQREFEIFRKESQARSEEANQVLARAHAKIADLRKEVRTLKTTFGFDRHHQRDREQDNNAEPQPLHEDAAPLPRPSSTRLHGSKGRSTSLRDKFHDDATNTSAVPEPGDTNVMSGALGGDRPRFSRPALSSTPRSPVVRAYDSPSRAAAPIPKDVGDLSVLAESLSRNKVTDHDIQLEARSPQRHQSPIRGAHLRQTEAAAAAPLAASLDNAPTASASAKSRLPPERRAAAMARLAQKRHEKKLERSRGVLDKENVQP
ncbi:DNA repair exonuclease SbcCD ATPase subunit [Geosmithia morbida]|uniref:DNA repair exonuclease SbcCD ATPase subunit n=1 Tax=Geosmithia morbida TaxID=1094350 RepID=A0A9P5D1U2_9HYPO|nr:DNA repair exonuclease SbcCD ATPase subunit [Geosmithia morbida]KAF4120826.1 DNA repair exonuclease SbcCD ATPase subunit [Geosmithia morbida]